MSSYKPLPAIARANAPLPREGIKPPNFKTAAFREDLKAAVKYRQLSLIAI